MSLQVTMIPGQPAQPQPQPGEFNSSPGAQYQRRLKAAEEVLESYRNRFEAHESRLQYLKNLIERVPAARGEKGEKGERVEQLEELVAAHRREFLEFASEGVQGYRGEKGEKGEPGASVNLKAGAWYRFWRQWLLGTDG